MYQEDFQQDATLFDTDFSHPTPAQLSSSFK